MGGLVKEVGAREENKKKLSQATLNHITGCLCACLNGAVKDDLLDRNNIEPYVVPLPKTSKTPKPYTDAEFQKLVDTTGLRHYAFYMILVGTDCRPGELLAATWGIRLENQTLLIDR